MKPRDYQQKYLDDIKRGRKNLVHLATGGGKSIIFLNYIKECVENKRPVLFIVYGNSILDQAVDKYFSDFNVTTMQGKRKWEFSDVLACSIATLSRKKEEELKNIFKYYKDIVVDEAHHCTADRYINTLPEKEDNDFTVVGLTATPYAIGKKGHTYWNNYIKHTSVRDLVDLGWLATPRCYTAQVSMDTKVKTTAGEFNNKQLFEKNDNMVIYSSIIDEYLKKGENNKAIYFAVNIEHSKRLAEEFNHNGIKAAHADADTDLDERKKLIQEFENGDLRILCNVNIFSTGVDTPVASVGGMARPTKSRVLWIQQVGRVLRNHPGKNYATILDHGGNIGRCGHPIEDFEAVLKDNEGDKDPKIKLVTCRECFFTIGASQKKCPSCGAENQAMIEAKERKIKEKIEEELKEIKYHQQKKESEKEKEIQAWMRIIRYDLKNKEIKEFLFRRRNSNKCRNLSKTIGNMLESEYPQVSNNEWSSIWEKRPNEVKHIANVFKAALDNKYKPLSVYFKVYEQYPNTNYLNFPAWFLRIKHNEQQVSKAPESNI